MRLSVEEITSATSGTLVLAPANAQASDVFATSLTWDSRSVAPGALYVALVGERVDGHNFAAAAAQAGAVCVLASHALEESVQQALEAAGCAVVQVADTAAAVTDLARVWRTHLRGRVIGLTGSTGKTTTKNLVRDVLAASGSVVATIANQNNELGVPNTLLSADEDTANVVVEMGMRGLGQIESLCAFAQPNWGLITNVGESHIELLGSRENIAHAKAELFAALPAGGTAFVNAADEFARFVLDDAKVVERGVRVITFGGHSEPAQTELPHVAAVWSEDVDVDEQGCPTFTLCASGFGAGSDCAGVAGSRDADAPQRAQCKLALRGLHNVSNATSAAAVGLAAGMSLDAVVAALAQAQPEAGRQEVLQGAGGITVINDAYNANPDSMKASLATFGAMACTGKRIAVLGDMGELGLFAGSLHKRVGKFAAQEPIDLLVCVGDLARDIAKGARAAGMDEQKIVCVSTREDALKAVKDAAVPGSVVLVKASHFMELNRVAEGLVG